MKRTSLFAACFIAVSLASLGCEATKQAANSGGDNKAYPLDVCIVTDNKLGSMGDPIYMNYKGQEVAFCCKPCIKEFEDNPQQYLAKLPVKSPSSP